MNPSFETALAPWHDFYVLVGTGSFTLVGLMFVAVTFGAHLVNKKNIEIARAFMDPTVLHFVQVALISCLVLVPAIKPPVFGSLLAALGALSLVALSGFHRGLREAQRQFNDLELADWISGLFVPLGVYIGFLGCGVAFWMGSPVFGILAALTILILLNSIYSAWELILWLAVVSPSDPLPKKKGKRKG